MASRLFFLICAFCYGSAVSETNEDNIDFGFLRECPGSQIPALFTDAYLAKNVYFIIQRHFPIGMYRKRYYFDKAIDGIGTDPNIDFKKRKTMVFMDGYLDSTNWPPARIATGHYAVKGYNTITVDSQKIFSLIYPLAARTSRAIGNVTAVLLQGLGKYGLKAKDIELVGISMGGQTVSSIGKSYYRLTGKKVGTVISMDPSGPCFRNEPPHLRISPDDGEFVQVIHTGNEGFGMPAASGHVDFYVNGGEFQAVIEKYQPWCDDFCSHVFSFVYYYTAFMKYSDKFVGVKCKNVQQAREHKCYDNLPYETNYLGPMANRSRTGIFYVPARAEAPFFAPEDFLEKKYNFLLEYADAFDNVDNFVLTD